MLCPDFTDEKGCFIMITKAIEKIYRKMVYTRADDNGCVVYFTAEDFEGLRCEEYSFPSSLGHTLAGAFYYYEDYDESRLIIFEHGMGSGHTGYMTEIERLCREGYRVFAYDHTGCMKSGGNGTNGFAQSLRDLDDAVKALKADEKYASLALSVIGHSWGGFSTLNISALHPDIERCVAMSGFIAVGQILKGFFRGPLSPFCKKILALEKEANPDYVKYSAVDTLKSTETKVLVIHSDDDKTVSAKLSFDLLEKELSGKENIRFLRLTGKNHNPNYTEDAVRYKDKFFAEYQKALRKKTLMTEEDKKAFKAKYDWKRMTAQDEKVWKEILDFLKA